MAIKGHRISKISFCLWPPKGEHLLSCPIFAKFSVQRSNTHIWVWYVQIANFMLLTNRAYLPQITQHEKRYLTNYEKIWRILYCLIDRPFWLFCHKIVIALIWNDQSQGTDSNPLDSHSLQLLFVFSHPCSSLYRFQLPLVLYIHI